MSIDASCSSGVQLENLTHLHSSVLPVSDDGSEILTRNCLFVQPCTDVIIHL